MINKSRKEEKAHTHTRIAIDREREREKHKDMNKQINKPIKYFQEIIREKKFGRQKNFSKKNIFFFKSVDEEWNFHVQRQLITSSDILRSNRSLNILLFLPLRIVFEI